ncbi:MAG: S8 family peptidase [Myxococcota bacterium]
MLMLTAPKSIPLLRSIVSPLTGSLLLGSLLVGCEGASDEAFNPSSLEGRVQKAAAQSPDGLDRLTPARLMTAPDGLPYIQGQLLIDWKSQDATEQSRIRQRYGLKLLHSFRRLNAEAVNLSSWGDTLRVKAQLEQEPAVQRVEPDAPFFPDIVPDDLRTLQWNLENSGQMQGLLDADVDAPEAWEHMRDCSAIVVAVVDSGIALTHPELRESIWINRDEKAGNGIDDDANGFIDDVNGWNFIDNNNNPNDTDSHGTHVSGIMAAKGNNKTETMTELAEEGMVGVCWKAQLIPIKALGRFYGSTSSVIAGMNYAVESGANIINASLSGRRDSKLLQEALQAAETQGTLVVVSAGNDGKNIDTNPVYPASYNLPNLITVGASTRTDTLADFSNYGAVSVDLVAPGLDIYSTMARPYYGLMSGTSMAAPHVSAAAAFMWAGRPVLTYADVRDALIDTVDTKAALSTVCATGGRLNLFTSVIAAEEVSGVPSPYVP